MADGMIKALKILVFAMAAFAGCARDGTPSGQNASPEATTPETLNTVMQEYNTEASQHLKFMEANFNKDLPGGVAPIVYVDYDKVATWFGMREGPATVDRTIGDYLRAKTGRSYDARTLSVLAKAMHSLDSQGSVVQKGGAGNCLVVPEYPDISFNSFYAASFRVGRTDLLAGKTVTIKVSTKEFADFADAHESWHCLDIRYMRDSGDGLAGAGTRHRAGMVADHGAAMGGVRAGG